MHSGLIPKEQRVVLCLQGVHEQSNMQALVSIWTWDLYIRMNACLQGWVRGDVIQTAESLQGALAGADGEQVPLVSAAPQTFRCLWLLRPCINASDGQDRPS